MKTEDIKKHAEDLQQSLAEMKHYDEVQNALLKRAEELKLSWPETKQFSAHVHKLKFPEPKSPKPASTKPAKA